jgi:hypothetical protein
MANLNRVNGFIPIGSITGAEGNFKEMVCTFAAGDGTAAFVGDLVLFTGTADSTGVPIIKQAAATDVGLAGAIVSVDVDGSNLANTYRLASTARYCKVNVDPNTIYEAQANASLALTDMGMNFKPVVAAGNTTLGTSGMQLDASTKATTSTFPLKVVRYSPALDNTPAATYNKVYVKINSHIFGSLGSTGVQGS